MIARARILPLAKGKSRPRLCENSPLERFWGSSDHYPMARNAIDRILATRFFWLRRHYYFSHSLDSKRTLNVEVTALHGFET